MAMNQGPDVNFHPQKAYQMEVKGKTFLSVIDGICISIHVYVIVIGDSHTYMYMYMVRQLILHLLVSYLDSDIMAAACISNCDW